MPRQSFIVDFRGVQQLNARLQPGRLLQPTHRMIEDLGRTAQKTAQRAAKPHPADKGTLGRAIQLQLRPGVARVFPARSIAGIAFTIEEGRRPGRRPPYRAIKRWAISHGIIPDIKGNSKLIQGLREEIRGRGTRGIHFMRQAQEATDRAMRERIPRTEQEIRAVWDRN